MSENEKEDVNADQIEWITKYGCSLFMTVIPKQNKIEAEGNPSIDETEIQIHCRIVNKEEAQYSHSDFVPNTKGNINKLLKEQFKIIKDKLLDKRFG